MRLFNAGIPCFTSGTLILTPQGERPIESLRPGDLVCTRDNGPQPLLWMAMRRLGAAELADDASLLPVLIRAGALGNDRPLFVSPQHGVLARLAQGGGTERLIRAAQLARMAGGGVRVARGTRRVTYVHLLFAAHQVVFTHGLASESFYPGPRAISELDRPALEEFARLFPGLTVSSAAEAAPGGYGASARPYARSRELPPHLTLLGRA